MVAGRKTYRISIGSHGHVADIFDAGERRQTASADAQRNQQGAGMVRLHQVTFGGHWNETLTIPAIGGTGTFGPGICVICLQENSSSASTGASVKRFKLRHHSADAGSSRTDHHSARGYTDH